MSAPASSGDGRRARQTAVVGVASGVLSVAAVFLPGFAPFWLPGLVFGLFVAAPVARRRGAGLLAAVLAVVLSGVGYLLAVVLQLSSLAPTPLPHALWAALSGAAGALVVGLGALGLSRWRAGLGVTLAGAGVGLLWALLAPLFPNGWSWLLWIAATLMAWQGLVAWMLESTVRAAGRAVPRGTVVAAASAAVLLVAGAAPAPAPATAASTPDAPRVVSTTPALHAASVDPGLTEFTLTFDRDMDPGHGSLTAFGATAPSVSGAAVWRSPREFVVPVLLEPGREYVLGVNVCGRQSLRSSDGQLAEPFVLAWRTAGEGPAAPALPRELNARSREELARALADDYSYRDRRGLDWPARLTAFAERLDASRTADEFAFWSTALLHPAQDKHLWVELYGSKTPTWFDRRPANVRTEQLPELVPRWDVPNAFLATGRWGDGVRYVAVKNFARQSRDLAFDSLFTAWRTLGDHPLVLDARSNGGGDEGLALLVAGCFVDAAAIYAQHVRPDPSAPGGFGAPTRRSLRPVRFAPRHTGKVAVLMGPRNVSSCESFLLMMGLAPQARLFGERTSGSSGNPQVVDLSNGARFWIPSWKAQDADGRDIEGVGVAPDVEVVTEPADFEDGDPVLAAALAWLRG